MSPRTQSEYEALTREQQLFAIYEQLLAGVGGSGLTDTELRATPVPISADVLGAITGAAVWTDADATIQQYLRGIAIQISENGPGFLTDAALRAQPVEVEGIITLGSEPTSVIGQLSGIVGATNLTVTQVTVTGIAATLVADRATRRSVLFRNTHTTASCWIGPSTVTAGNGFLLKAGESIPFTWTGLFEVIDDGVTHPVVHVADEYQ